MRGTLASGLLAVIIGVTAVAASSTTAAAQPANTQQQAADLVQKGIQLQTKHDTDGAVALYKQAYCLIPEPALVYNMGTAYQEANKAPEAMSYFRLYLKVAAGGDLVADAKAAIKSLQPSAPKANDVATILCETKVAPVCIDGTAPVDGKCGPIAPPTCGADQELVNGSCVAKTTGDPGGSGGAGNVSTEGTVGKKSKKLFYAGIGTAGVGVVAMGVGIVFGMKAKSASDALSNNMGDWTPELLAKQQEGKDAERNQIIFTIVGGAALASGAVMIVLGMRDSGEQPTETHARVVPYFAGDAAGFALTGRY